MRRKARGIKATLLYTTAQLTEGRSAQDQPKQPPAKKTLFVTPALSKGRQIYMLNWLWHCGAVLSGWGISESVEFHLVAIIHSKPSRLLRAVHLGPSEVDVIHLSPTYLSTPPTAWPSIYGRLECSPGTQCLPVQLPPTRPPRWAVHLGPSGVPISFPELPKPFTTSSRSGPSI